MSKTNASSGCLVSRAIILVVLMFAVAAWGCSSSKQESEEVSLEEEYGIHDSVDSSSRNPSPSAPKREQPWSEQVADVVAGESKSIQVRQEDITDAKLSALHQTPNLQTLVIEKAAFTLEGLNVLLKLPELRTLKLAPNIGDDEANVLVWCTNLTSLNLPHSQLTSKGIKQLTSLSKLELLRIGGDSIDDDAILEIQQFPALRFLHLIDTSITDASLQTLAKMPNLESLYLDGATVSSAAIERLIKEQPKLHLHIDQKHHDRDPRKGHE